MATHHHHPQRISLIIRHLRPSLARRRALTTSAPASAPPIPVPIRPEVSDPVPSTPTCPPSRCPCAAMPSGLAIDYERPLYGTMPPYAQHVVVRTGQDDWPSRIEDEDGGVEGTRMNFARSLKGLVGRGGKLFDVCTLDSLCLLVVQLIRSRGADARQGLAPKTHPHYQFFPFGTSGSGLYFRKCLPTRSACAKDTPYARSSRGLCIPISKLKECYCPEDAGEKGGTEICF